MVVSGESLKKRKKKKNGNGITRLCKRDGVVGFFALKQKKPYGLMDETRIEWGVQNPKVTGRSALRHVCGCNGYFWVRKPAFFYFCFSSEPQSLTVYTQLYRNSPLARG